MSGLYVIAALALLAAGGTAVLRSRHMEVLQSEDFAFPVTPGVHSHDACLRAVERSHVLLVLVGDRFGGRYLETDQSITWREVAEAKRRVSIPLVGNGDATSAAEAVRMLEETGCDAVMIGRASFGNPWIFRETRALLAGGPPAPAATPRERLEGLRRQYRLAISIGQERRETLEIRKHVAWYVKGLPNAHAIKARGQKVETRADVEALVDDYLEELDFLGVADVPGVGASARTEFAMQAAG